MTDILSIRNPILNGVALRCFCVNYTRTARIPSILGRNAPLPPINFLRQRLALTSGRAPEAIRLISTSVVSR